MAARCWGGTYDGLLQVNLNPADGALTGLPGTTVVWGAQVINTDATNWILITGVFAPDYASTGAPGEIPDPTLPPGDFTNGAFTDYLTQYFNQNLLGNGLILKYGQIIDLGYSSGPPTAGNPGVGLASEAISATAGSGFLPVAIDIQYEVFDRNLFDDGAIDLGSGDTFVSTSVTVDQGFTPSSDAPEPGTWLSIGLGLAVVLELELRRRQSFGDLEDHDSEEDTECE